MLAAWATGSGCELGGAARQKALSTLASAAGQPLTAQRSGPEPASPMPPAGPASGARRSARTAPPRLAPAVPHEAWRPGYALVELATTSPGLTADGAAGQQGAPAARAVGTIVAATPPVQLLGGVQVQALRELVPSPGTADGGGAIVLYALPAARDAAATRQALAQLATDPRVARVEPDRIRHAASLPNDPLLPAQWSLPLIRMPQAWELAQGSESVVVAFLDTGIVRGHPDLEPRLLAGYDFVSDPLSAGDGDGTRDPDPSDPGTIDSSRLHGLHVAGTIGAVTNNGLGIAGVDQKCRLLPVRVLGVNGGDGIDSDIADAVRWASGAQVGGLPRAPSPAHVLNLSFGGPGVSFTLQRAIDDALSRGVAVVAAAGNGGADAVTYSPGGLDGVITVGALDRRGARASYSNFGPRVDLLAPGGGLPDAQELPDLLPVDLQGGPPEGVLSTYRDDGVPEPSRPPFTYGELVGTSQAAPHVSGAVALVKSLLPGLAPPPLAALLRDSADPRYQCPAVLEGGCGAGLLDVASLLRLAEQQRRCGCGDELYCVAGVCTEPAVAHPSIYDRPVLHGGWCGMGGPAAASSPAFVLILAATAIALTQRRREPG
jgi:serine protease